MKKISLSILVVQMLLLFSCEGKFEPITSPLGAVELQFPENETLCLEGQFLESGGIQIPFRWSPSPDTGEYRLEVTDQSSLNTQVLNTSETEVNLELRPGTLYVWEVYSLLDDKETKSTSWSFYSEGITVNRHAPFPALITINDQGNGAVDISWTGTDLDEDILNYDLYLSTENPPALLFENLSANFTNGLTVTSGLTYYVEVITRDSFGNSSKGTKSFRAL